MMAERTRLFYYCYDHQHPTGGQKHTYQHVDILTNDGWDAYVLHSRPGVRLRWFENTTRVVDAVQFAELYRPEHDFLVLPEDLGVRIARFPGRKVVFNKNVYEGFHALGPPGDGDGDAWLDGVVAIMAVSTHNSRLLQYAFPKLHIASVTCDARSEIFRFRAFSSKHRLVAYSGKMESHVRALYHVLQARSRGGVGCAQGIEWVRLDGLTEAQAATLLQKARCFVSLSGSEGISRSVLEAMLCGCVVCCYGHPPLDEYLPPDMRFEFGDIIGLSNMMESVLDADERDDQKWSIVTEALARRAASYSRDSQRQSVLTAWREIVASCNA